MRVIYKGIYWVFMMVVVTLGLLLIVSIVPIQGAPTIKVVKSGSMEPAIKTGAIVVGRAASSYAVGDIITFGADTKTQIPTTHRIAAVAGEGASQMFTTKGDANDAPDPTPTSIRDVHSKVLFSVPYVGYMLSFARQPLGFALLVGVPAALIILEELGKILKELSRMRRKRSGAAPTQPQSHEDTPNKKIKVG